MTGTEMITGFKIRRDWYSTPVGTFEYRGEAEAAVKRVDMLPELCVTHKVEMSTIRSLLTAINEYLKSVNVLADEYEFRLAPSLKYDWEEAPLIPEKYWRLIAYATEGDNEGYYIHVGALILSNGSNAEYMDFGFAKTYGTNAYDIAREAQRFLTASQWN